MDQDEKPPLRHIALALILRDDRILIGEFRDPVANATCYRPLGGGIELGEDPEAAMRREMREELGAEFASLSLHSVFENHFFFRGKERHALVHLFRGEFTDETLYRTDLHKLVHDTHLDDPEYARWLPLSFFREGNATLLPQGLIDRLGR